METEDLKNGRPSIRNRAEPQEKDRMISAEDVFAIFQEQNREKREKMIDALSDEQAKYILKCYANFLNRWSDK